MFPSLANFPLKLWNSHVTTPNFLFPAMFKSQVSNSHFTMLPPLQPLLVPRLQIKTTQWRHFSNWIKFYTKVNSSTVSLGGHYATIKNREHSLVPVNPQWYPDEEPSAKMDLSILQWMEVLKMCLVINKHIYSRNYPGFPNPRFHENPDFSQPIFFYSLG